MEMNLALAACIGHDPEWWFAKDYQTTERKAALTICRACPIRESCLERAMAFEAQVGNFNRQGTVGGLTALQRVRLAGAHPKRRAPEQHGTPAGYRQHGRNGSQACRPCLDAMAARRAAQRSERAAA